MSELFPKMSQSILDGDTDAAAALALQAVAEGSRSPAGDY